MKYENIVEVVSNYATNQLPKVLEDYGQNGFQLVNAIIAKNKYDCDVMYLFFTKQKSEAFQDYIRPTEKGGVTDNNVGSKLKGGVKK